MNAEQAARWETTRARGLVRFVITHGIFQFGIPMTLLLYLYDHFVEGDALTAAEFARRFAFFALAGGVVYGFSMWFVFERMFARWKARAARDPDGTG